MLLTSVNPSINLTQMQRLILGSYKVLIPLVVLDELSGLCKSTVKGERAHRALQVVNKFITDKSVSLLTSKVNFELWVVYMNLLNISYIGCLCRYNSYHVFTLKSLHGLHKTSKLNKAKKNSNLLVLVAVFFIPY